MKQNVSCEFLYFQASCALIFNEIFALCT